MQRRRFVAGLGAGVGASLAPSLTRGVQASLPPGAPGGLIQLNSNENPYGPGPRALDAFARAAGAAARYPDAAQEALVDALARHHGVSREEIVLGCGSSEILQVADQAFLGGGRTLVSPDATFEAVLFYARATKSETVKVPLTADFRHDLPAMARACGPATGLVYVCNPNNPTGTIVTRDEMAAFLKAVPATMAVLVDEAYHHFVEDAAYDSALTLRGLHANVIVARTFSKIYGLAGLRLGYAVAARETAEALRAFVAWDNVNAAVLAAAAAVLADEAHVAGQRRRLNATRAALCAELARDGRRFIPSHANFLMIETGAGVKALVDGFRARGILVGRFFESMPTWLRVSIGTDDEMRAFLAALRALVPRSG